MTNKDVIEQYNVLMTNMETLEKLRGIKFAYMLNKNIVLLKNESEFITKHSKPNDAFINFENSRIELCKEHCKKNESGELILTNNNTQYDINLESTEWKEAYNKLISDNDEVIKQYEKEIEDYKKFLKEENELELYKISLDEIPQDISVGEYDMIKEFIKEI